MKEVFLKVLFVVGVSYLGIRTINGVANKMKASTTPTVAKIGALITG